MLSKVLLSLLMLAPATCQLESQASASQPPLLRGASLADSRKLAATASTNASAGHVEPPAPVQLLASVKTEPVNRTAGEAGAAGAVGVAAAGFFPWGRGHAGETCCMCSYQYGGPSGTVVVFAGEDYDNAWGGHDAFWHCEHECELKCQGSHSAHKFGCLDEAHLRGLERAIRYAPGFSLEHQHRYGNLC